MSFDLNFHLHRLLKTEPFFAAFSRRVEKAADNSIPTAAMAYNRETQRFVMLYNPDFFESLTDVHKAGVIKHEFYHLILKHLTARLPFDPVKEPNKSKTWNIAADLAINTHLVDELPEFACIPGYGPFVEYALGCTAEAYFKKLMQDKESEKGLTSREDGESNEPGTLDDHSSWGDIGDPDGLDSQVAQEKLKEMTKEAAEVADNHRNWGSVPHSVRQEIRKMIVPTISPEAVLRYFIKTSTKSNRTSTIRRINPRYPYIHPGRRAKRGCQHRYQYRPEWLRERSDVADFSSLS